MYVQPLERQTFDLDGLADGSVVGSAVTTTDSDGDYRTIDPKTGAVGHSATYVAPYMYFERLTYDAKTMALLKRQRYFDNTKYADPNSTVQDVGDQLTNDQLIGKLVETVEKSAYRSIHSAGEVSVTAPRVVVQPASAPVGR